MPSTDFNTWNRALHFTMPGAGSLTGDMLRERTLNVIYVDRITQFDTIEWRLDNRDGELTKAENVAMGLVVGLKLGYLDETFPWKVFIINRLQGGVGISGREHAAINEAEATITYFGRNRNAAGGKPSRPWKKTASPPPKKKAGKVYPPTMDMMAVEAYLNQKGTKILRGRRTSDIVTQIAERNGFRGSTVAIETTKDTAGQIAIPPGLTDGVFLSMLANQFRFIYKVEDGVLHWHSPYWQGLENDVVETLFYGGGPDILELNIDADFRLPVPTNIKARVHDYAKRMSLTADASVDEQMQKANMGIGYVKDLLDDPIRGPLLSISETVPVLGSLGTATQKIQRRFVERHWNAFALNVKVVGNPRLLAGKMVRIRGTGSPLVDGKWLIGEARHTVDRDTYVVELKLRHPRLTGKPKGPLTMSLTGDAKVDEVQGKTNTGIGYVQRDLIVPSVRSSHH